MSIRMKLVGGCDALLLGIVGVLQVGLLVGFAALSQRQQDPVGIDTNQAHVEVLVVEATKISRG